MVEFIWTKDYFVIHFVNFQSIHKVKQSEIGLKAKASIQKSGENPALFKSLIMTEVYALELLISRIFKKAMGKADKVTEAVVKAELEPTKIRVVNELVTVKSESIFEMPKKSELASKYLRLADIYTKLEKQNTAIYQREQQLDCVEKEPARAKGLFKGKKAWEIAGTDGAVKSTDFQHETVFIEYRSGVWI